MIRAVDKWLPGYLASVWWRPRGVAGTRHLFFCVADHFEPLRGGGDPIAARRAVATWVEEYRRVFADCRDATGRPPRHTFFFPAEEYDRECLATLAVLCREGYGEVEIHLHHRHDTAEGLHRRLTEFRDRLHQEHGLLGVDGAGRVRYGFVHGNWALCNARPDGDWCGVNDELRVLRATGCYADFTFPSAPSPTQPRMVNAIYYAVERSGQPRSADRGSVVRVGGGPPAEPPACLLIITGPLGLDWRNRKWGLLPRLENGALTGRNPPTARRVELWVRQGIHVRGRPDWVFVKVHTHGCVPENRAALLGSAGRELHAYLQAQYNDGRRWRLHYVTGRELYNLVKAAEAGCTGAPDAWRDFEIGYAGDSGSRTRIRG